MRKTLILATCLLSAFALARAEEPPLVTSAEMQEPGHLDKVVRVQGTIRDVFADELNPQYAFLVIYTETGLTYATTTVNIHPLAKLRQLVNAKVEAKGFCRPSYSAGLAGRQPRLFLGRILALGDIRVIEPPPADPFDVPEIVERHNLYPYQLQQLGIRKASGHVIATWGGNTALVETPTHSMMRVEMVEGDLPSRDDFIEIAGRPDTDIYRINFTRARWRKTQPWPVEDAPVRRTSALEILTDGHGTTKVDFGVYGKTVAMDGVVMTLPGEADNACTFQIDNNGYLLPVDVSSCRTVVESLVVGAVIRVTGVCILNIGNYRPNEVFPQVSGFSLVVNDASGIEVVSRPSWWTARRLVWLLAAVLAALAAVLVWNRSLSVLAEKRGRQLSKEQVARAVSELKVGERTRLSAELHDALSQTLSGIAMQLGAIKRFSTTDPARMSHHLDIASRTLKSCRDEMRNILWDLRSQVLDEPDIEKAIQQILEPCTDGTDIRIRFAVPRDRLTESTARAIFCIVRELVVNAIRHGGATSVRIAGSIEDGHLLCSVRDNGCGFDTASAPGAEEGHFGLQGIRERMEAVDGSIEIESAPGRGTRVVLSMPAPFREKQEETEA